MKLIVEEKLLEEWLPYGMESRTYVANFIESIKNQPPADAAMTIYAHWNWNPDHCHWKCSNCGGELADYVTPYCPWCGAKMNESVEK